MRKTFCLLPLDIDRAHIDDAFQTEASAQCCRRHPVHPRAGLGDDALLAHAPRQQDLAEHIVHLVRTGVIEFLALEVDFGAPAMRGQPLGEIERRRASDIMREIAVHLLLKGGIGFGLRVGLLQLQNERHQRLGDEPAAIDAEVTALVRPGAKRIRLLHGHAWLVAGAAARRAAAARAARTKARILSGSFSPGARSTPDETSTPGGCGNAQSLADIAGVEPAREHEWQP